MKWELEAGPDKGNRREGRQQEDESVVVFVNVHQNTAFLWFNPSSRFPLHLRVAITRLPPDEEAPCDLAPTQPLLRVFCPALCTLGCGHGAFLP